MTTVGLLVGPGRRAFDIAVVREVYDDRSDRGLPRPDVRILAARPVTEALDGLHALRRHGDLDGTAGLDLLVVPGMTDPLAAPDPEEVAVVAAAAAAGVLVASLCTGAFTLAAAGVLDGRAATTHWRFADGLPGAIRRSRCGRETSTAAGVESGPRPVSPLVSTSFSTSCAPTGSGRGRSDRPIDGHAGLPSGVAGAVRRHRNAEQRCGRRGEAPARGDR